MTRVGSQRHSKKIKKIKKLLAFTLCPVSDILTEISVNSMCRAKYVPVAYIVS